MVADSNSHTPSWLRLLHEDARSEFARELREVLAETSGTASCKAVQDFLYSWRATALALWDEEQHAGQPGYHDDAPVPLARP